MANSKMRVSTLLLAALMAAQTLASCGGSGSTTDTQAPVTNAPEEDKPVYFTDSLGDIRFDGETFTLYRGYPTGSYIMEEETGDILDDSIFLRNRLVEERLGITLDYVECNFKTDGSSQSEATSTISSFIMAGDDTNDVYVHVQHTGMPGLIAQGCFVNWRTVPNLDLSQDYWYQRCLDDINYYDKVFAMTGAYNLSSLTGANCLYFNKNICDDLKMDYPYQDVLDGKWIYDKFYDMTKAATIDVNGDGKIDVDNDQLGYFGWGYEQYPGFFMGMGGDSVLKKADGSPELNINNDRTIELVEKMNKFFQLEGSKVEWTTYGIIQPKFSAGECLFYHTGLSAATSLRDMEDDFGFIPYPKLNEAQEGYRCRVQNTTCLTYIPVTNNHLDFTGAVLEVLASCSYNTVVPAFFDTVLTVKSSRDTESELMVPVIREACAFNDEAISGFAIRNAVDSGGLASYWAGVENTVKDSLQKNIIDVYGPDSKL